ncbi:hypothetical protein KDA_62250 [Dictyobacter alpinus]|uniref:Uncharacterized protein n=1 Tax=Dictyobacter alpinus TaxID=2014873 RepID=A0A402BH49_9CHLR|nr:hypothetical protein [Dictyobacter alpinus]GCE30741.1 hypothetical protein KDA_62250 [Dictyobacter alpinus]
MTNTSARNSQSDSNVSRAMQCKNCHKTFTVVLTDGGKDIHFLNMISWDCPACKRNNLTPFLRNIAS